MKTKKLNGTIEKENALMYKALQNRMLHEVLAIKNIVIHQYLPHRFYSDMVG